MKDIKKKIREAVEKQSVENEVVKAAMMEYCRIASEKGEDSKETLDAKVGLALAYIRNGKREDGISLMNEIYERKCELFGKLAPSSVRTFCAKAQLCDTDDFDSCFEVLKEASDQIDQIIDTEDWDVMSALHNYAYASERFYGSPAFEVYLTMCEWVERVKGKGCKEHIHALSELADAYFELELDEDAIEVGKTIYSYSVAEYGMDDEYTALVLENLAKLYYLNGETDEALDRLDLLLEVYERNQPKVEKLIEALYNSSLCYWRKDDKAAAIGKLQRANGLCSDHTLDSPKLKESVEKLLSSFQSGKGSIFLTLRFSNLWGVMS